MGIQDSYADETLAAAKFTANLPPEPVKPPVEFYHSADFFYLVIFFVFISIAFLLIKYRKIINLPVKRVGLIVLIISLISVLAGLIIMVNHGRDFLDYISAVEGHYYYGYGFWFARYGTYFAVVGLLFSYLYDFTICKLIKWIFHG
jgi:hypothetical protein